MKAKIIAVTCALFIIAFTCILYLSIQGFQSCPSHIGIAHYELNQNESETEIIRFFNAAIIGIESGGQSRWPGTHSPEEAVAAYRDSLRYRITNKNGKLHMDVYCVASSGETAADAVSFAGYLWYAKRKYSVPSMPEGLKSAVGRKMSKAQKIGYSLGIYPVGRRIPAPQPGQADAGNRHSAGA